MKPQASQPEPQDLTEMVLRGVSPDERLLMDDEASAECERLESFVDACRSAARLEEGRPALTARFLDAAKNEDLSWRGDLRLVGRFFRESAQASAMARWAAASLLVYLAALPVVALYVLRDEPIVPEFRVEVGVRELPYSEDSPLEVSKPSLVLDESDGVEALLVENSMRWSRWQLLRLREELVSARASFPAWLRERTDVLLGAASLDASAASPSAFLAAELALDSFLVDNRSASSTVAVEAAIASLMTELGSLDEPGAWLALSAFARAESYGVLGKQAALVLTEARESTSEDHPYRAFIEVDGDLRRRLPLDPLWVEAYMALTPERADAAALNKLIEISALQER